MPGLFSIPLHSTEGCKEFLCPATPMGGDVECCSQTPVSGLEREAPHGRLLAAGLAFLQLPRPALEPHGVGRCSGCTCALRPSSSLSLAVGAAGTAGRALQVMRGPGATRCCLRNTPDEQRLLHFLASPGPWFLSPSVHVTQIPAVASDDKREPGCHCDLLHASPAVWACFPMPSPTLGSPRPHSCS